ncbi:ATP-binding protein [Bordetella sp. 02P26C-1]|uniref:ATP-binding protein n=1 Tax=Bordetella sp. 02P26C-1 TaxID=2683195 RepID=UPI001353874B|nr:ATP-binding protein [Bordetella sp. 02P26C-1]MVW79873.1 response regulator [Bordetella sp. 02P26C-1]
MAQQIRAFSWADTSIGPPDTWPERLRSALSLCLSSRFPIVLWWGPDMRMFYNDAYIPFLGPHKHPGALWKRASEAWPEIWDEIGPMLSSVYAMGEATWRSDHQFFFERALPREEVYFTFTYGPILASDGVTVEGIFCPCTETTEKILSTRRLNVLRQLSTRRLPDGGIPAAAVNICAELSTSKEDVPFAAIYSIEGEHAKMLASTGLVVSDAEAISWPLQEVASSGQSMTVELSALDVQMEQGAWPEPARFARLVPLDWLPDGAVNGVMVLGVSPRRPLDEPYRDFLALVASHSASALNSAATFELESRRAQALAELDRAKTAFFSNVSHEFRTPLTLILGPVEEALENPSNPLDRKQLHMLHRNALRLQKLVNTLLDFSRIEAGQLQACFEPVNLGRVTAEHVSAFRSAIEAAGLRLRVDCDSVEVYVARDLYEKILLNLLSNAFKYTPRGEIAVTLRDLGTQVELCVSDTGIGIAGAEHQAIFERFHRVEGVPSRTHEGTGIGLTLVRELVKLHGGSIRVDSQPGAGSAFTVRLPKGTAHLRAEDINRAAPPKTRNLSGPYTLEAAQWLTEDAAPIAVHEATRSRPVVLYVDDNADMRDYLGRLLATRYEVRAATDGASALASIRKSPPDLLIADVMMPGLDGLSLLRAVRSDAVTRALPVILLSAKAGEEARVEGMEAGADDYLVKPFSARELVARVSAHLRLSRLRQETLRTLRANEVRLRTIIEQLPVGLGVADVTGRWILTNSMMSGYAPMAMPTTVPAEHSRWRAWDENEKPVPVEDWPGQRALRGEVVTQGMEMQYTAPDGREYWLRSTATPLRTDDRSLIGACLVLQDITELKRVEQELLEAHRRKDEFLATLAHELRNPLSPMHNGLYLLKQGASPEETARIHDMLQRQVAHMHRLVDDLLEIARINNGRISLRKEPVEIADVVRNALETCRAAIEAGEHTLTLDLPESPIVLEADPVRLAQVISNVLTNAAKYTNNGGHIRLRVRCEADAAVISVTDNGVGIPADQISHVFDLFTQLDGARGQGGLGIGLTLVRTLVELHGGRVDVHSGGHNQGSEFVLRLPMPPAPPRAAAPTMPMQAAQGLGRILVVDDNRDSAETTSLVLESFGAQVQVAADGPSALAMLDAFQPEVIMLDIGMPGMNGYEVARRVREAGCTATLVAMTGWGQEDDRRRSKEAGFDHHLVKPMNFDALERLLVTLAQERACGSKSGAA